MKEDVIVRVGTPEDVHGIMDLGLMACAENGVSAPNPEKILFDIWPSLNCEGGIVGVIGAPGGQLEGFVLLRTGSLWYSDAPILEEKIVFVHPKYRSAKGGRARKLCEFSKKASEEIGLPLVIGIVSNSRTKSKVRLYERVFGEPAGAFFLYGARTGTWNDRKAAE
jgi:hypothetical protein